jgi:BTB/POZ domain
MATGGFLLDLSNALLELLEDGILCDTELLTDSKSVWTHSIVLAAASKSLRHAFMSASLLSKGCRYQIRLNGCDSTVVETVLRFLYTGQIFPLTTVNSGSMLVEKIYAVCKVLGVPTEKFQQALAAVGGL